MYSMCIHLWNYTSNILFQICPKASVPMNSESNIWLCTICYENQNFVDWLNNRFFKIVCIQGKICLFSTAISPYFLLFVKDFTDTRIKVLETRDYFKSVIIKHITLLVLYLILYYAYNTACIMLVSSSLSQLFWSYL